MVITLIMVYLIWVALSNAKKTPIRRQPRIVMYEPISPKELERQRKQAQARELALADIDRTMAQRESILAQLDSIEEELATGLSGKRADTLLNRKISTEAKLYNIDRKLDKLYMVAYRG